MPRYLKLLGRDRLYIAILIVLIFLPLLYVLIDCIMVWDTGRGDIMEVMLGSGRYRVGRRGISGGFTGMEIRWDDSFRVDRICSYVRGSMEGICMSYMWDEYFTIAIIDEYERGYIHGLTFEYANGELCGVGYIESGYFIGNAIYSNYLVELMLDTNSAIKELQYTFTGIPYSLYGDDGIDDRFSYVVYNHEFVKSSYDVDGNCSYYVYKGNNLFCIGKISRLSFVMLASDSIVYSRDTLLVFNSKGILPLQRLTFSVFFFSPPSSKIRVCVWEVGQNQDSICYRRERSLSILSSEFYRPKEWTRWYFPWFESDTMVYVSQVEVRDTLFDVHLSRKDTTVIVLM